MAPPAIPVEAETALRQFRQFYQELFTVKRLLREGDWATLLSRRAAAGQMQEQVLLAVRLRLRSAIAAQGFGGPVAPGAPAGVDPGYVMAAVADATLLHDVAWPGRDGWAETPLEVVLYRSRIAGDRIFQAVEEIGERRTRNTDGVAMTILLAFEMGFRGRYRGFDDNGEIERVKEVLFERVFHAPYAMADGFDGLTVGAAEPLAGHQPAQLPRLRPWVLAIGGVTVAYLLVSWLIWWSEVNEIVHTARDVAGMTF